MTNISDSNPRIYVACLAAYNNGYLHGAWIDADQGADEIRSGPAPVLFRSRAHVRRPFVRRPLVISSRGLNVSGAGCRSR